MRYTGFHFKSVDTGKCVIISPSGLVLFSEAVWAVIHQRARTAPVKISTLSFSPLLSLRSRILHSNCVFYCGFVFLLLWVSSSHCFRNTGLSSKGQTKLLPSQILCSLQHPALLAIILLSSTIRFNNAGLLHRNNRRKKGRAGVKNPEVQFSVILCSPL